MIGAILSLIMLTGIPISGLSEAGLKTSNLLDVKPPPCITDNKIDYDIEARSGIVVDLNSSVVLYEHNSRRKLPVASLTKLMTAIIISEENDINETVTVNVSLDDIEGSKMYLIQNEKLTVGDLLHGILIASANDGAKALAKHNAGSVKKFVEKMNKRSKELGLLDTHFTNPIGYDEKGNYSTARDIAILSMYALKNDFIRDIVSKKQVTVISKNGKMRHELKNTNKLIFSDNRFKGLKTGTTDNAGQCLVSLLDVGKGREIITVLLNSPSRFQETIEITTNIFRKYKW